MYRSKVAILLPLPIVRMLTEWHVFGLLCTTLIRSDLRSNNYMCGTIKITSQFKYNTCVWKPQLRRCRRHTTDKPFHLLVCLFVFLALTMAEFNYLPFLLVKRTEHILCR